MRGAELPPGSTSKLAFTKGSKRGELELDVYGTYAVSAEAVDEAGRRGKTSATIEVRPPKTKDVLVQLVWAGFDRADTSDTFPRVNLRVTEPGPRGLHTLVGIRGELTREVVRMVGAV